MIIPVIVAIVIPLGFLYLVRWLDLYASGSFKTVLICFGWGLAAFFLSLQVNNGALSIIRNFNLIATLVAPIVEEIFKSLVLVYFVRRPEFTYFVDGAIYGFAAGTGFAVIENLFYLSGGGGDTNLLVALSRVFSTSLMHGSASALVGISLGRLRFGRGNKRLLSVLLGWASAMTLHLIFNNLVNQPQVGMGTLVLLVIIGLGGVGLVAAFIFWGLSEERKWLHDTLKSDVGVSREESSVVQKLEDLNTLLVPIGQHFGEEKRKLVEHLLHLEAQLGLKVKTQSMTPDPKLRESLGTQIADMEKQIDQMQRKIGLSCMTLVRMIIPNDAISMLERLQTLEVKETLTKGSIWNVHAKPADKPS
jgi:RsiW-degrading membrane proteinase PrsW (M82 family)